MFSSCAALANDGRMALCVGNGSPTHQHKYKYSAALSLDAKWRGDRYRKIVTRCGV